jgi:23S rRNA pseudouridine1911/1915/1917 synthase
MTIVEGGREARTAYRVRRYYDRHSLVEVTPHTGRTHQIRVHLAAVGHPVVGDSTYGRKAAGGSQGGPLVGRQFLHAYRLGFRLPSSGEHGEFESPLPSDLVAALRRLEGHDSMATERNFPEVHRA